MEQQDKHLGAGSFTKDTDAVGGTGLGRSWIIPFDSGNLLVCTIAMAVWWMVLLALAIGLVKGRFVFSRFARKNILRIRELSPQKEKICIFAFQAMQSYLIIIGMVTLGILLRLSPLPRELLA